MAKVATKPGPNQACRWNDIA